MVCLTLGGSFVNFAMAEVAATAPAPAVGKSSVILFCLIFEVAVRFCDSDGGSGMNELAVR